MGNVSTAVEKQNDRPAAMIDRYPAEFTTMLPSHLNGESWLKTAKAALKKGKVDDQGRFEIEQAAANNPATFFQALREAATLGLRPGSDEYYLTCRKINGRMEILGIVGYQGLVELIYRGGAASSVIVEAVYSNDGFRFSPGRDEIPMHDIDWDADDRGTLRLAYAYCRMKGGGYSKVVVLNKTKIEEIKQSSTAAGSKYSPWQTNPESMWLKSAVRQLVKWVPTSTEYREALRADAAVLTGNGAGAAPIDQIDPVAAPSGVNGDTGEIVDAELVDTSPGGEAR